MANAMQRATGGMPLGRMQSTMDGMPGPGGIAGARLMCNWWRHTQGSAGVGSEVEGPVDLHGDTSRPQHDVHREEAVLGDALVLVLHAHGRQGLRHVPVQARDASRRHLLLPFLHTMRTQLWTPCGIPRQLCNFTALMQRCLSLAWQVHGIGAKVICWRSSDSYVCICDEAVTTKTHGKGTELHTDAMGR